MFTTMQFFVYFLWLIAFVTVSSAVDFLSPECEAWVRNVDDFPLSLQYPTAFTIIYTRDPDRELLMQSVSFALKYWLYIFLTDDAVTIVRLNRFCLIHKSQKRTRADIRLFCWKKY